MKSESSVKKWLSHRTAIWMLCLMITPGLSTAQEINWLPGPGTMSLGDQAEVYMPEGYLFADANTTQSIMEMVGNPVSDREVGLITSGDEDSN